MAPTGLRQRLPHNRARVALHTCRLATRRHRIARARSALRCRVPIRQRHRMGTRPCSRSRGGEVLTLPPSVAFLHTILRTRSPNRINIEHLDTFMTDGFCVRTWYIRRPIVSYPTPPAFFSSVVVLVLQKCSYSLPIML
jgi:hypothetical protein